MTSLELETKLFPASLSFMLLFLVRSDYKTGYAIQQALLTRQRIRVSYGTLYPYLHKLEERGLLKSEISASEKYRGISTRSYSLTEKGMETMTRTFFRRFGSE